MISAEWRHMDYIAYLLKERGEFPEFPGCVTAGKTLEEARRIASATLGLHIRGMLEDGETLPEPSSADDVAKEGAVVFLV